MRKITNLIIGTVFVSSSALLHAATTYRCMDILEFLASPLAPFCLFLMVMGCVLLFTSIQKCKKRSRDMLSLARGVTGSAFLFAGSVLSMGYSYSIDDLTVILLFPASLVLITVGLTLCLMSVFGGKKKCCKKENAEHKHDCHSEDCKCKDITTDDKNVQCECDVKTPIAEVDGNE